MSILRDTWADREFAHILMKAAQVCEDSPACWTVKFELVSSDSVLEGLESWARELGDGT